MNRMALPDLPDRLIENAVRLYGVLLVLYPTSYRREYGPPMVQLFRDVTREAARRQGAAGIFRWWLVAVFDLLANAIAERRHTPLRLNRATSQNVLLLCLIAGGVCLAVTGVSQLQPGSHYTFRGVYGAALALIYPAFILLALGTAGLAWAVWPRASALARLLAVVSCAGMALACAVMLVGVLVPGEEGWAWHLGMTGFTTHYITLGVFGLFALRARLLKRWNIVPVLMSLSFLVLWVFNRGGDSYGPQWGMCLTFVGLGVGYGLIGISVWRMHLARVTTSAMPV